MTMGIAEKFAKFASETTYDALPEMVVKDAKRILLESIAVMVLGSRLGLGKMIGEVSAQREEPPEAILVGRREKGSLKSAVFYNTAIADCNDSAGGYYRGTFHPGKNVVPASLTVSSARGKDGRNLILAMVTAIECCSRIVLVMGARHGARGFYSDGTVGAVGSAIAVGKLFDLDKDRLAGAIGNAALLAPCTIGGSSMFRSTARPLAMGLASANSILAVMMAEAGILGPLDIFECPGGFCQALADVTEFRDVTDTLGIEWETTKYYHKPFVGCRLTHLARQGAGVLKRQKDVQVDEIERVIIRQARGAVTVTSHHAHVGANVVEHSCSGPYLVANVLLYDDVGPGVLTEERMNDPKVHQLADKIEIIEDPELTKGWETKHSRRGTIQVILKGGEKYLYSEEFIKGDPFDEWRMTDGELEEKLRIFASSALNSKKIDDILEMVSNLEQVDDAAKLMRLLSRE